MAAVRMTALLVFLLGLAGPAAGQTVVRWSMSVEAGTRIAAGGTFEATVTAVIEPGWHLYALSQPPGGPEALAFSTPAGSPFQLSGNVIGSLPITAFDANFGIDTLYHDDRATFALPLAVADGASGVQPIQVDVWFQTCTDQFCLPPTMERLSAEVPVGGTLEVAVENSVVPVAPAGPPPGRAPVPDMAAGEQAGTLAAYLGLAALMGALSLLTPCVFPMVPITVSYFTNRAEARRSRAVLNAAVYGVGIVLTFTALGFVLTVGFGASGLNRFAADPWLNLAIAALFVAFALNLFGAFELRLPSRLVTMAATTDAGAGRFGGTLLMGLAFTLTSFTCTAPFLGTLLVVAAQGDWQWPLAGLLAFSAVFALPFVVLAFVPQVMASLPRSGGWLLAVKATMGLLELAAAMKFLSNADLVWGWGVFTRDVVLGIWVVIGAAMVAYLSGVLRIGHAPRLGRPGMGRAATAAATIVLTAWLATGLQGRRLGELEAFLPPADLAGGEHGELPWIVNDYEAALDQARLESRPVLVDFTGYTCTNCRWMEANMFTRPEVARELGRYVRLRLYTDGRGDEYRRYQDMQREMFGTVALPYYAILQPSGDPVVAFGGLTRDAPKYVAFLRRGLEP